MSEVRQLRFVELEEDAGLDLAGEEIRGRHHDIVAGLAGEQLCLQGIVGVERVVADLDPGLFAELVKNGWRDIVRPVVEIDDALRLRAHAWNGREQCSGNHDPARRREGGDQFLAENR
jgi:hypothetical protein